MNRLIRNLTSFANLMRSRREGRQALRLCFPRLRSGLPLVAGQAATLLILLTVILLIFAMVTLNVGQNAVMSTTIANAADAAALSLASNLGTTSRQIYSAQGGLEHCEATGWASSIFALVLAIIAVVATILTAGALAPLLGVAVTALTSTTTLMAVGAVAGAIGGAIGGAYSGTGAGQGAVTGAAIGAAVGAGGAGFIGAEAGVSATGATLYAGADYIALGALTLGSVAYNQNVTQKMTSEAISNFSAMMNKLSEADRLRESAFLLALTQLVDDPTVNQDNFYASGDYSDSDLDGNATEYVPDFQIWEFTRLRRLGTITDYVSGTLGPFMDGAMTQFKDFAKGTAQDYLARQDYDWDADGNAVSGPADGIVVKLLRGLEAGGPSGTYPVSFWDPGPTPDAMNTWLNTACTDTSCPEAAGFDEVDGMADEFLEMATTMEAFLAQDRTAVYTSWEQMVSYFYDPGEVDGSGNCTATNPVSYYCILGEFERMLGTDRDTRDPSAWMEEIDFIEGDTDNPNNPPECILDVNGQATNYPCVNCPPPGGCGSGTIDAVPDDEFWAIPSVFDDMRYQISSFRSSIKNLYDTIYGVSTDVVPETEQCTFNKSCGGTNPVKYEWTDVRGPHSVTVQVGGTCVSGTAILPPKTTPKKKGNWLKGKTCSVLTNYEDGGNCWLKVRRYDSPQGMGALGTWNPFGGTATKAARLDYSYDHAGLQQ